MSLFYFFVSVSHFPSLILFIILLRYLCTYFSASPSDSPSRLSLFFTDSAILSSASLEARALFRDIHVPWLRETKSRQCCSSSIGRILPFLPSTQRDASSDVPKFSLAHEYSIEIEISQLNLLILYYNISFFSCLKSITPLIRC